MTIAELNDAFRRSFTGGQVFVTRGISALPQDAQTTITARVRSFEEFDAGNDPYGEHDFGSFDHDGETIFWKIDCYDRKLKWGSPDPADPTVTTRVHHWWIQYDVILEAIQSCHESAKSV